MTDQSCHLSSPMLSVDGGIHRRAEFTMPTGRIGVGSDADNAMIVSDLSAPTAFTLTWNGRKLVLRADGCDLEIEGKVLRRGRERRLARHCRFSACGLPFSLTLPADPEAEARSRRGLPGFAIGVICTSGLAAMGALLAAPSWPSPSAIRFPAVSAEVTGTTGPSNSTRPSVASAVPPSSPAKATLGGATLAGAVRQRLTSAGLDGISIDLQPDGAIAASGHIMPAQGEAWHAVARWFDTAAEGRSVLVDRVDVSASKASLQVQAAYTGRTPYIIDGDGQKLFLGSSLPDGWVIQQIESQRVLLRNGSQVVAVRF